MCITKLFNRNRRVNALLLDDFDISSLNLKIECHTYDVVSSWFDIIGPLIDENKLLEDDNHELVVIEGNNDFAKKIFQASQMVIHDGKASLLLLQFDNQSGELLKAMFIEANEVQHEDAFSEDLKKDNGVLRLNKK